MATPVEKLVVLGNNVTCPAFFPSHVLAARLQADGGEGQEHGDTFLGFPKPTPVVKRMEYFAKRNAVQESIPSTPPSDIEASQHKMAFKLEGKPCAGTPKKGSERPFVLSKKAANMIYSYVSDVSADQESCSQSRESDSESQRKSKPKNNSNNLINIRLPFLTIGSSVPTTVGDYVFAKRKLSKKMLRSDKCISGGLLFRKASQGPTTIAEERSVPSPRKRKSPVNRFYKEEQVVAADRPENLRHCLHIRSPKKARNSPTIGKGSHLDREWDKRAVYFRPLCAESGDLTRLEERYTFDSLPSYWNYNNALERYLGAKPCSATSGKSFSSQKPSDAALLRMVQDLNSPFPRGYAKSKCKSAKASVQEDLGQCVVIRSSPVKERASAKSGV